MSRSDKLLGSVAQLVERSTENREVTGSTPVGATTRGPRLVGGLPLLKPQFDVIGQMMWCSESVCGDADRLFTKEREHLNSTGSHRWSGPDG